MQSEIVLPANRGYGVDVVEADRYAAVRVLEANKACSGEMEIDWFDRRGKLAQIKGRICLQFEWLRLDPAKCGCTTAFEFVRMCFLPDDVLVAAAAMRQKRQ